MEAVSIDPSPAQIAQRCAEIQSTWSEAERYRRAVGYADSCRRAASNYQRQPWEAPLIWTAEIRDALAS